MRNALAKGVGAFAGVAGGRGGSCLFLRREDKFPSPPTGSLGSLSLSCSSRIMMLIAPQLS